MFSLLITLWLRILFHSVVEDDSPSTGGGGRRRNVLYAVRGGMSPGLYDSWPEAVDAGWHDRAPYGNAVTFPTDQREKAEQWIVSRPRANGNMGRFQERVRQQHIFVRILFVLLLGTLMCVAIWKVSVYAHNMFECDSTFNASNPICVGTGKLKYTVQSNMAHLQSLVMVEVTALVVFLFTYLASFL